MFSRDVLSLQHWLILELIRVGISATGYEFLRPMQGIPALTSTLHAFSAGCEVILCSHTGVYAGIWNSPGCVSIFCPFLLSSARCLWETMFAAGYCSAERPICFYLQDVCGKRCLQLAIALLSDPCRQPVQARSRPVQPPKKPEAAPFFLPTVPGLEGRPVFDTQAARPGLGDDPAGTPASRASKADKNKGASDRFVRGAGEPNASPA